MTWHTSLSQLYCLVKPFLAWAIVICSLPYIFVFMTSSHFYIKRCVLTVRTEANMSLSPHHHHPVEIGTDQSSSSTASKVACSTTDSAGRCARAEWKRGKLRKLKMKQMFNTLATLLSLLHKISIMRENCNELSHTKIILGQGGFPGWEARNVSLLFAAGAKRSLLIGCWRNAQLAAGTHQLMRRTLKIIPGGGRSRL